MKPWDEYFLGICNQVASNSKCLSRQIGAILVRDRIIVATGYNGPPRGFRRCPDRWRNPRDPLTNEREALPKFFDNAFTPDADVCPRRALDYKSGERLDLCPAVHAEINCVAAAARVGVNINHTTMYMNAQVPCKNCMGILIDAGIGMIVVTSLEPYDQMALTMLNEVDTILSVRDYNGVFLSNLGTPIPSYDGHPIAHEGDIE